MANPFQPKITEHDIQASLFNYCTIFENQFPQLKTMFAIPNGFWAAGSGKRKFALMNKYKAEGLKPGIPDICLPLPSADGKWNVLFLECKKPGEKLNDNQKKIHQLFNSKGIRVEIFYSRSEALNIISNHLKIKLPLHL